MYQISRLQRSTNSYRSNLKHDVKKFDYVQQTALRHYGQALTPPVKELDLMQGNREPEVAKSYNMDSFKILCLHQENMSV